MLVVSAARADECPIRVISSLVARTGRRGERVAGVAKVVEAQAVESDRAYDLRSTRVDQLPRRSGPPFGPVNTSPSGPARRTVEMWSASSSTTTCRNRDQSPAGSVFGGRGCACRRYSSSACSTTTDRAGLEIDALSSERRTAHRSAATVGRQQASAPDSGDRSQSAIASTCAIVATGRSASARRRRL